MRRPCGKKYSGYSENDLVLLGVAVERDSIRGRKDSQVTRMRQLDRRRNIRESIRKKTRPEGRALCARRLAACLQAPRAFTRPASLETFRLAVRLCRMPLLTERMISGWARRSASAAAA